MTNPEPGWYDDGSGHRRWWDGTQWTEHVASAQLHDLAGQTAAAGWYDDGSGRQRWWDGQRWGAYTVSATDSVGRVGVEVSLSWPLWLLLLSDPGDPSTVHVRVHPGFDPNVPPGFDSPGQLADATIDDWEGAPLNIAIHSTQRDLIASLGPEIVEIVDQISRDVHDAIGAVAERHASPS